MSVQEKIPYVSYIANGSTVKFNIPFDLHNAGYLVVTVDKMIPAVGGYIVNLNDMSITFVTAPRSGAQVELYRDTKLKRDTNYQSYDNSFRPSSVNFDFDSIWQALQDQHMVDARIAARIREEIEQRRVADGLMQGQIEILNQVILSVFNDASSEYVANKLTELHSLIQAAAAAAAGANGWTANLVAYHDISQKKINDGLESIAEMLAINSPQDGMRVDVKSYHAGFGFGFGGGTFIWDASSTAIANNGTVFSVSNISTGRWLRQLESKNNVSVKMFGAVGDGRLGDQQCISKAYEYLNSIGGGTLYLPNGTYLIEDVNYVDEMPTAGVVGLQEQYAFPIYSNITVLGQSRENTIFKMADGIIYKDLNRANLGCALFADAHKGLHVKNFRLERFKVDMNGINNPVVNLPTTGLGGAQQAIFPVLCYFDYYYSTNITVDNIWVHQNSGMNSIFIGHKSTQSVISNCLFTDHSDYIDGNDLIKDHSTIYIAGLNNLVQNNMFVMGHDPVSTNERTKTSYISTAIEAHGVNTIVTGNIVDGYGAPFLAASTEWYNGDTILFANNKAYQAQIGFAYNSMNGQLRAQFIGNEVKLRKAKASNADNFLRYAHAAIESQGAMNSIVDRSAAYSEIYVLNNVFEQEEPTDWNDTDKFINICHNVKEAKLFVSKGNTFKNFKGTSLHVLEHRNWLEAQIVLNSNTYINCGQDKTYSLYRAAYMLKDNPQAAEAGFAYNLLDSVIASNETFIDCNYGVLVAKPNTLTAKTIDITGVKYLGSFITPVLIASPIDMTAGHTINIEYETTGFVSAGQTLGDFQGVSGKLKMNKWSASNVDDYLLKNFEYVKTPFYAWNMRALSDSAPTATGQFGPFPNKNGDRVDILTPSVNGFSNYVRFNNAWYGTGKIDATNIVT